ncbi:MAG: fructosamine kinase, partial [Pseudonocardia sp.]|nr:fructosamine kinase [Pseudonocardia sp.]
MTRVDLDGGRAGFAKSGAGVAAEAAGLRWLAVPGGPAVPQVLSCDGDRLVTEYVATVRPTPAAAAVFGR